MLSDDDADDAGSSDLSDRGSEAAGEIEHAGIETLIQQVLAVDRYISFVLGQIDRRAHIEQAIGSLNVAGGGTESKRGGSEVLVALPAPV